MTPLAKLSKLDIPKIKELAGQGQTQRQLAKEFNVSQRTIWGVLHAEVWQS